MKEVRIPPMHETALGQFMAERPTPASELRPPPPYRQEESMTTPDYAEMAEELTAAQAEEPVGVECPDCGKWFAKNQALGVHRARAHGYRSNPVPKPVAKPVAKKDKDGKVIGPAPDVNPIDALLQATFPGGIPADRDSLSATLRLVEAYDALMEVVTRP